MKLCTFRVPPGRAALPGVLDERQGTVTRLDAPDLITYLADGMTAARAESYLYTEVRVLAPIPRPPSIRDFFAFERHVATTRALRGRAVPEYWYQEPVFYFTNPAAVIGPDEAFPYPHGTERLDYELEIAAVIGANGAIAGFTIMNDFSARDLQRGETSVGLGPAKGKDFATALGPYLVTVDEFDGSGAAMVARVNGAETSRGELAELHYPWKTLRDRATLNTRLRPGDVLGSGTVGSGCILELDGVPWLQPGDAVELEVTGLGTLRNSVGPPAGGVPCLD